MPEYLYERLTELLGKPPTQYVSLLGRLVQDLGEEPTISYESERHSSYNFDESGISLKFDHKLCMFWMLYLRVSSTSIQAGSSIQPYPGNLPFGIKRDDSEDEVEKKFPGSTMAVKDYRTDVDLRPLTAMFSFGAPDSNAPGVGERKLRSISVTYECEHAR